MALSLAATLLLNLLEQPRFGSEVAAMLRRRSAGWLRSGPGTIYPALARLDAAGLVRSWTVSVGRGRPRRYYELTPKGARAARDARVTVLGLLAERAAETPDVAAMGERIARALRLSASARHVRARLSGQTAGA
jgi:DNA-binding PadR family transcriptional regulator